MFKAFYYSWSLFYRTYHEQYAVESLEVVNNRRIHFLLMILNEIGQKISNLNKDEAKIRNWIKLLEENCRSQKPNLFLKQFKQEQEKKTIMK